MRFPFSSGRSMSLAALVVALGCVVGVESSLAQCSITGPSSTCGLPVQLCGPTGGFDYEWTGPNGFSATTRCVNVSDQGTYSLRLFDYNNGIWFGPCTHVLSAGGSAPACQITGPTSVCSGTSADLCGPDGSFTYAWTGPNGFASSMRCVSVSVAGTYSLTVTAVGASCSSAPCSQVLQVTQCQGNFTNCPRTASFWRRQCGPAGLTRDQVRQVGDWVDEHSRTFNWQHDGMGLCRTVDRPNSLRERAHRQFAALLANVAAQSLGLRGPDGNVFGLDPKTEIAGANGSFTLQSWINTTDQRLSSLGCRSPRSPEAQQAYRNIAGFASAVNHGRGIGQVCRGQRMMIDTDDDGEESASLDAQMKD